MVASPLAQPAKAPRPTLGSVTPRPPSSGAAQRLSSRSVTFLKVTFPLIALVLLGLVLAWPRFNPDPREFRLGAGNINATVEADASKMVRPRFVGVDQSNQPYSVVADTATQAEASDRILLAQPKADVTLKDGSWVAVDSREGLYDRVAQTLGLRGQVHLFHDAGYEFHTESADLDMKAGTASGDAPVEGQGPFGHLEAEGFRILDKGGRILFTGKSKIELRPDAAKKPGPTR